MKAIPVEVGHQLVRANTLRRGQLFIIVASTIWGSSFVFIKWGVEFLNPFIYLFFRFLIAAIVTLPIIRFVRSRELAHYLLDKRVILVGLINTLAFFCEFVGIEYTTAGMAAILTNVQVVFVALLAYLFLGEQMDKRKTMALTASILGVLLIAINGDPSNLQGGQLLGNLLILVSGILWAVYIVASKFVLDNNSGKYLEVNSMELTYAVTILTMMFSLPPALIYGFTDFSSILDVATLPAIIGILYMGFMCTTLAYFLYFEGLKRVTASASAIYLILQTVFAVLLAFLFLGEIPTLYTLSGGILIGASIYLVS